MPYVEYDEVEAICPDCGRLFRSEEQLDRHRSDSHTGTDDLAVRRAVGGWPCTNCGRTFGSEVERNRHAREKHYR